MLYPWLTPLIAAFALGILAIAVSRRSSEGELPQVFVFFAVVLCFWNLNFFVLYSVTDVTVLWELSRFLRTGTLFLPPAILHLFLSIDPQRPPFWRWILVVNYAFGALLSIANAFDLLVLDLHHFEFGYASVGGVGYDIFTVFALANAVAALSVLVYYYRTSRNARMRQQLGFWIAGSSFATPLVLTNLLPAYGVPIYPPGNLGSAVWAGIIGYAIVRHRLLDIELVVSRGLSYFIVSLVLLVPFTWALIALQRYAFGSAHYDATVGFFIVCIITSICFSYLRLWIEARFESSLLREKREARETLVTFGKGMVRMFDERRILRELGQCIEDALQLTNLSIFTAADQERIYRLGVWRGDKPPVADLSTPAVLRWLEGLDAPVLRSELPFLLQESADAQVSAIFEENQWELIVPLLLGGRVFGFLALGPRRAAQPFASGDLEVLEALGAQASVAVENARLHERLRRSREIIHRSDRLSALGTLAAGIAHEIRNPLVSIQTFFQLAPERIHDEEFMSSFLGLAEHEVTRIRRLIGDLLSYAKGSEPELVELRLAEIVDRAKGLLMPHAHERRVQLSACELDALPAVEVDGDQLLQAVINIVLNAIDATPAGGEVEIRGSIERVDDSEFSCLTVRDTGRGIPAELLEAIFDPFFTTKDEGTGLGLAISHRIVSDLGGFLSVSSVVGEGSAFVISIPAGQSRLEDMPRAAAGSRH